jgi:hypothetical protein
VATVLQWLVKYARGPDDFASLRAAGAEEALLQLERSAMDTGDEERATACAVIAAKLGKHAHGVDNAGGAA